MLSIEKLASVKIWETIKYLICELLIYSAKNESKNCPCGELMSDCSYPYCGLGGETLEEGDKNAK